MEQESDPPLGGDVSDTQDLVQIAEDAKLLEAWAAMSHGGSAWDMLAEQLVRQNLGRLRKAAATGQIFEWVQQRFGVSLTMPSAWTEQERNGVVGETMARALHALRCSALEGKGWTRDSGFTLSSHFFSLCLSQFTNVFKVWLSENKRAFPLAVSEESHESKTEITPCRVVADRADLDRAIAILNGLPDRQHRALSMRIAGKSVARIAMALKCSPRQVHELIYRARKAIREKMDGDAR